MSKIAFVTDSTAYIPKEFLNQYPIRVVPQVLIWGNQEYRDGVDIQPDEFYTRLATAKVMPSTSQVTPKAFLETYRELIDQGYEILNVLLSAKLSGTIASAVQAKEFLPEAPIEIVDSETTAMAMGFLVLEAARAAQQGATMAECIKLVEAARSQTGVIFAVDTLEFLYRGGRIGGGTRFLGSALNIKPILELQNGVVEGIDKVRTRRKSLQRVMELIVDRVGARQQVHLATLHANARAEACELLEMTNGSLGNVVESVVSEVSPVVGTHAGPGTVGMCFLAGM
jgi:DegV family protein with EDD domain